MKLGAGGQGEQVKSPCRNVLPKLARQNTEALGEDLVEKLGVNEVNLAKVEFGGIPLPVESMLNRHSTVRVSLDTQPLQKRDAVYSSLAELV